MKFLFLFSYLLAAGLTDTAELKHKLTQKETLSATGRQVEWSFADARRPHLIQGFDSDGQLVWEKSDSDGNLVFEKSVVIDSKKHLTEKKYDDNQDGLYERLEKFQQGAAIIVVSRYVFDLKTKSYEKVSESKLSREKALSSESLCQSNPNNNSIFESVNAFKPLLGRLLTQSKSGQWTQTTFGPRIHDNCIKKFGKDFPAQVQQTLRNGISCLAELDGPASRENLTKIASLLENSKNPLTIYCGKTIYKSTDSWPENFLAEAKIPGDEGYPAISFNPAEKRSQQQLQKTLFHELLHNCGYLHDENQIEYMYACPECCSIQPRQLQSGACLICSGHFSTTTTIEYQMALADLYTAEGSEHLAMGIVVGNIESRRDAPLAFLKSIQQSVSKSDLHSQLYEYYKSQGLIDGSQKYLNAPDVPGKTVSPEVEAFAKTLSLAADGKSILALSELAKGADQAAARPAADPLRGYYRMIFNLALEKNTVQLDANSNDTILQERNKFLRSMVEKFNSKK